MTDYIKKATQKADILLEAMPYINKFHNKTVVIKYGGSAMTDENIRNLVIGDIAFMKMVGINPVIVHGGGPEINAQLKMSNIEPNFVNGIRVTDKATMKTVEMVLSGQINKSLVSDFQRHNAKAVGISGKDGLLIEAQKKQGEVDLGYVGDIVNYLHLPGGYAAAFYGGHRSGIGSSTLCGCRDYKLLRVPGNGR